MRSSERLTSKAIDLRHDSSSNFPGKTKALIDSTSENPWERAKTIDPKTMKKTTNESALIFLFKKEMNMKKTLSYRAKRNKRERERRKK